MEKQPSSAKKRPRSPPIKLGDCSNKSPRHDQAQCRCSEEARSKVRQDPRASSSRAKGKAKLLMEVLPRQQTRKGEVTQSIKPREEVRQEHRILVCGWVRGTHNAQFPTVEHDRYGFSIANFNRMDSVVNADSFVFPLHCQQVFLSDDARRNKWKIVCRTDVRGRRSTPHEGQHGPAIIDISNDADFEGLAPVAMETEPIRRPDTRGSTYVIPATKGTEEEATANED